MVLNQLKPFLFGASTGEAGQAFADNCTYTQRVCTYSTFTAFLLVRQYMKAGRIRTPVRASGQALIQPSLRNSPKCAMARVSPSSEVAEAERNDQIA